jgi:adenosylcobinamide-GDP ribazoletransferase
MKPFILMLQFLTRIPINVVLDCNESDFKKGIYWFTTVGAVLGILLAGSGFWLGRFVHDSWISAILLTLIHILFTGGLHLDGVADSADGLLSNRDSDRMLEIMKDSRIGSNGVLALIFVLALKTIGFKIMMDYGLYWAMFAMPVIARSAVVYAFWRGTTPREHGMGNLFIGQATIKEMMVNLVIPFVLILKVDFMILALGVAWLFTHFILHESNKKIGGITGDVLGAIIELNEVVFGLVTLLVTSYWWY